MITATDLRKSYGDTPALQGLSFAVTPGTICGLLGPDGAGKTTAMRIVCGLLRPDQGHARVLGLDPVGDGPAVKPRLGYMPQRFSLYPDLTVAENLAFFADLYGVTRRARQERETELLAFSRLDSCRDRRAGRLSGGMKQKLALSCTLIHTPEVLVLDEPTTGVDPVSRREFWRILAQLAGRGLSLLVSTPYMDEADRCDHIVLMHSGRALTAGPPAAVAAAFRHQILEVSGPGTGAAWARLRARPPVGVEVHRFGDRLHLIHATADAAERVRELLTGTEVATRAVAAGVEDVFVDLLQALP